MKTLVNNESGFTLLDSVVSMVFLSVATLILATIMSSNLENKDYANKLFQADLSAVSACEHGIAQTVISGDVTVVTTVVDNVTYDLVTSTATLAGTSYSKKVSRYRTK